MQVAKLDAMKLHLSMHVELPELAGTVAIIALGVDSDIESGNVLARKTCRDIGTSAYAAFFRLGHDSN